MKVKMGFKNKISKKTKAIVNINNSEEMDNMIINKQVHVQCNQF